MRATTLILTSTLIASSALAQRWQTNLHQDPAGFSVNLPQDWRVQTFGTGSVAVFSPNPGEFVLVMPVLGRAADCASTLRDQFAKGWQPFPGTQGLSVKPTGRGVAVAAFQFQGGQSRGAVMCAETGQRSAMFYAIAAPGTQFSADRDSLLSILRSFRYGGGSADKKRSTASAVQMEPWVEQSERAFTGAKPAGWRVNGGVTRISNSDVRTGFQLSSPDGTSGLILGDTRLNKCMVPGQFSRQFTNQAPMAGTDWCPYRTGEQVADMYALKAIAADWRIEGLRITGRRPRPDLTSASDRLASSAGPSNYRNAFGEVTFEGTRRGAAVSGRLIANTLLLVSPDPNLMGGNYTQDIYGFLGPKGSEADMAALMQRVQSSIKWNMQWVMANRAAGQRDTEMVRRYLESQSQLGQQMFQDRMASADRRSAAVGDVLSGQVRLRDNEGNQYEAHAGSNYYYLNEQQSRLESNRSNAVMGADIPVPLSNGSIDLRPLEVIR